MFSVIVVAVFLFIIIYAGFMVGGRDKSKKMCERAIARALQNPKGDHHFPFLKIEASNDLRTNITEYLAVLPPYKNIECFDRASFVFLAHDWDCLVKFEDGREMLAQSIWLPTHQVVRVWPLSKPKLKGAT